MKNLRAAIFAACVITIGSIAAMAQDTAYGTGAGDCGSGGVNNSAFGGNALGNLACTGNGDTAVGTFALSNNTGSYNTATGAFSLIGNTTGEWNTATGYTALVYNTTGNYNTALSVYALFNNTTGSFNTGIGSYGIFANSTGSWNTAIGYGALDESAIGSYNIGVGGSAGSQVTTGSYNIEIGNKGTPTDNGVIRIGTNGNQTSFFAAGINGVQVSGVPIYIDGNGQLGTINSSIRFKEDVHDMGDASSKIFLLRPVTYRYKQAYADGSKPIDYGLIAEEVAKVYPDMVVKGADGQIQTVQYQKLTPMLLNELQKQHQLLENQQQTIAQQQQTIAEQGEAMRKQEISIAEQGQTIRELKEQQTATIQMLEKRLAALESSQTASDSAIRHAAE